MEILLLGTGAAEGIPALYSNTRVSDYARQYGGRDIRTRSGALIDGSLKIDLPPETLHHIIRERLDARDWSALIFTHGDDDHFAVRELQYFLYPFSSEERMPFPIYGNDKICSKVRQHYPNWPIELFDTHSFQTFQHGDFKITPIRAYHNADEDSQNLLVERGDKSLLYATDTGIWQDETWEFLAGRSVNALVIECTEGLAANSYHGHLNLDECVSVVDRLREMKFLGPEARVVTTHHSHNGNATYGELCEALAPHRIEAGYDGLRIRI
jgi:phosphoribosyl 1,2-cyclic phosphate phosphodiesterase